MVNSYLQRIEDSDFPDVLKVFKFAETKKIIVCIDGSYGTSKMHAYDNSRLACYIADNVSRVPIVIIHSGGYRVMEAMLLAADKKNVLLDTSFSLNYYLGSSLEQDYAFVYKRLGSSRVLFGTDVPYMSFDDAFNEQFSFFERFSFRSEELENIFYNNAIKLADGIW
jgi:predicted TIM-barrel fold metal-dependent hydrolase